MINSELLDTILLEWSYRLKDGIPDVNDPQKIKILNEILKEHKLPIYEEVSGQDAEDLTVLLWNATIAGASDINSFVKKYNTRDTGGYYAKYKKIVEDTPQIDSMFSDFKKSLKGVSDPAEKYSGQDATTSEFWKSITGKPADEPKTDVKSQSNVYHISVKKGPAQLMSGEKKEALATFYAASKTSNLDRKTYKIIEDLIKSTAASFKTEKLDTKELQKSNIKQLQSKTNKEAKKILTAAEKIHDQLTAELNTLFSNNKDFRLAFTYESLTGEQKFGSKSLATANYVICYNKEASKVKIEKVNSIKSAVVNSIANASKITVSFKSGSYKLKGEKAGYRIYSALRLQVKDLVGKADKINEMINNNPSLLLNEGWLDSAKSMFVSIMSGLRKIYDWFKNALIKLAEAIKSGFNYVLDLFEIEPEVETNLDNIDVFAAL